jgi:DNA-binding transcriptional LysR family regulator
MLDLHRLRLLRELSHRGTLAAVAGALAYSPSAVSQQLTKLESEAGVPLFERIGRGVRLTTEARILVAHTEAVLARLEQAEADLAASRGEVSGTVRVAAFQSVALALVPAMLTRLGERHPHLRVDVTVREPAEALVGLAARDFDLVVDEEYPAAPAAVDDQLDRQLAFDDPLQLVVPTEWGAAHDITDVADRHWVLEPSGTPARAWSEMFCRERGFEPDVRFAFDDLMMRLRLVEAGHAAALLPGLAPDGDPRRVAVLALPADPVRRISTVVRRGAADHPALVAVREALPAATGIGLDDPDWPGGQTNADTGR